MAQWSEERELHILVLASLGAQYFLVLLAGVRKFHIPPWLKLSFRLAHIGSDALAIFALATLFNHHKNGPRCSYVRASHDLELIWAPILLMHLGGQVVITSYKIEDNENSSRYILTSLSKVTVALYVFYKTWSPNDKRLLAATALLFVVVIIRCLQKALALKGSSFIALREANSSVVHVIRGTGIREERQHEHIFHFIEQAKQAMECSEPVRTVHTPSPPIQLFMDFPYCYSDRLILLRNFWSLDRESAYRTIECALSTMTSFLYTKDGFGTLIADINRKLAPFMFLLVTTLLTYATLATVMKIVVQTSMKDEDVWFTCSLLTGTVMLEMFHFFVEITFADKFSGRILQHSLIGLFAHKRRNSTLRSTAGWLQCRDWLDGFWRVEPSKSCKEITELIRWHVQTGWMECIRDPYSYKLFNDTRGEWTLARNRCLQQLGWSTRRPFDESILLWHLATDLYIHKTSTSPVDHVSARQCKEMSNYMAHLLFDNPEMLMPGSRKRLLAIAYEELEVLLEGERTLRDEKELTRRVFEKCELAARSIRETPSFIGDAWEIAQSLLIVDETKIWELIRGVWLEMLCYSAGRCRGYLHAESLGTGVEYLSYVWLLLVHTGMETFPEKLQRSEGYSFDSNESMDIGLAQERGDAIGPFPSRSEGTMDITLEA